MIPPYMAKNMNINIKCCLDCTERRRNCHDDCEKYISERAAIDEAKAAKRAFLEDYYSRIRNEELTRGL